MNDTTRPTSEQSQTMGFKRRDFTLPIGRNPPPKKGKSGSSFGPLPKKGGVLFMVGVQEELDELMLGDPWEVKLAKGQVYRGFHKA
jgi:hypothetical protein